MAVTLPAEAALTETLTNRNIGLTKGAYIEGKKDSGYYETKSWPGDRSWEVDSETITGTVKPKEWYSRTKNSYTCYESASSTLTITNNGTEKILFSFSYKVPEHGTLSIDNDVKTSSSTYSKQLDPDTSVTVTLTTPAKTDWQDSRCQEIYTATAMLSNIQLKSLDENVSVTLQPAANGNYTATAGGAELTPGKTYAKPRNTEYTFTATPDPGYSFIGWYVDGQRRSSKSPFTTVFNDISESYTITARFASKGAAVFETGDQIFDDLNEAVETAQKTGTSTITLVNSGSITGTYTIPTGITLLIPFDEAKTLYTSKPDSVASYTTPSLFRKLTMASGSSITVYGAISVGGKHCHTMGNLGPSGPYGQIDMAADSSITLNGGANLYAWGYITGDGRITATSGAAVYEYFQVKDWRGGLATTKMLNNGEKVFPLSQYYVQNIEAALTLEAGAAERTYISISVSLGPIKSVETATIDFIGSTNSLFRLDSGGRLTKKYDPKTDRVTYTTTGSASLDSLALGISGYNIDSKKYVLPVSNNMTLERPISRCMFTTTTSGANTATVIRNSYLSITRRQER